jgi:hypothetical protein
MSRKVKYNIMNFEAAVKGDKAGPVEIIPLEES